jgi:large subunit ribosomal protein L10
MPNETKVRKVKQIADRLKEAEAAVLTGYRGLTVGDAAALRAALADVDTRFAIVKNSLTRLAAAEAGLEQLADLVDGPTAIAFIGGDPVAGAKALVDQSKRLTMLEVRGGWAEGRILTADEVRRLAALESREEMLAKLAGLAKVQMARTAFMLKALQARFVRLVQALQDKLPPEEVAETEPAAPGTEAPPETETEPETTETEPETSEPQPAETEPARPDEDSEGGE